MRILRLAGIAAFAAMQIATAAFAQTKTDSSGYLVSFDKTKIYYGIAGSGDPIVLIHGFMNDGQSWKKTAVYRSLLQAGYRVITPDMRGNGRSDKPHTAEAYDHDAEARDIMALAGSLGLRSYSVVGYSRGSIITARLLVLDKRIRKAVMGGMGTDFTNPEWPRRKMFYRALIGDTIPEMAPVIKHVRDAGLDQLALAYMQKEQPSTSKEALAKVKQPVLVICGDRDDDIEKARALATIFKHARFASAPGDHGAAVATKEFADQVLDFFAAERPIRSTTTGR